MGRTFNGSTQYFYKGSLSIPDPPMSFSCWYRADVITGGPYTMISVADESEHNTYLQLMIESSEVKFRINKNGTSTSAVATTAPAINSNQHACGTIADKTSGAMACYFNGGSKGTATSPATGTYTAIDNVCFALLGDLSPSNYWDGWLWDCAIWDVVLTDDEVSALGQGTNPMRVRPQNIMGYYPLLNENQVLRDATPWMGTLPALTQFNSPALNGGNSLSWLTSGGPLEVTPQYADTGADQIIFQMGT